MYNSANAMNPLGKCWIACLTVLLVAIHPVRGVETACTSSTNSTLQNSLSPYMNSIPPSMDYLCVGTGSTAQILHPDRAPHTDLAMQGNVVLFSGAAPQQGLNFALPVGSTVYRNQMSTLGSAEPPPQVGTAGMLLQKPWSNDFLPWTEARWHPGEDITWRGLRAGESLHGLAHHKYSATASTPRDPIANDSLCSDSLTSDIGPVHPTKIGTADDLSFWSAKSSFDLLLSRGIYQVSKHRTDFWGQDCESCPETFRDPWFQGRGFDPAFAIQLDPPPSLPGMVDIPPQRISNEFFPNFHNVYTFRTLSLDGGRLKLGFEASATSPRNPPTFYSGDVSGNNYNRTMYDGGTSGTSMAESVTDEYGNSVHFDRVPEYGWENDFKSPFISKGVHQADLMFERIPSRYFEPKPNAWRLPHKRLRTVQLTEQGSSSPLWSIAFVYEHPESDHIGSKDTMPPTDGPVTTAWSESDDWKSIFSHTPQALDMLPVSGQPRPNWKFGGLPDLNDATTLLTVQAYQSDVLAGVEINGGPFQDDCFVWDKEGNRVNDCRIGPGAPFDATDRRGDANNDRCPGECGENEDLNTTNDGNDKQNEDTNGNLPYLVVPDCEQCQIAIRYGNDITNSCGAPSIHQVQQSWSAEASDECGNPLYWKSVDYNPQYHLGTRDPFSSYDDDEDGLIDEDGEENPLLVHMRALGGTDDCATGKHPFVPSAATLPTTGGAPWTQECRPPYQAVDDPWTYQVQYVYARINPYWLLRKRVDEEPDADSEPRSGPAYYYHPPFTEPYWDENNNGQYDDGEPYVNLDGNGDFSDFPGNIHADCVPHPNFHGPQGLDENGDPVDPASPSGIHLIKRIVRMRADVENAPNNFTEQTWLYRYNDIGFLKAVFDPADVQAIIDLDPNDSIKEPDDILKLGDAHDLAGKPLITYASQWYTYYNPYVAPGAVTAAAQSKGLPQCYESAPRIGGCVAFEAPEEDDPSLALPPNACDGEALWQDNFQAELHVDADCSPFFKQNCSWCYARNVCSPNSICNDADYCQCENSINYSDDDLRQMGIPDARPRFRKWMIKTARMRGGDGNMHLYRLDYLGAAGSAYEYSDSTNDPHISSYADAHNITIVDEIVEQDTYELTGDAGDRNDFYIYEDDFAVDLDSGDSFIASERPGDYGNSNQYRASSHRLEFPAKVKTRRVVIMNYYGIAMSDRLILTPGFNGTQTSFVDNQQFELINKRGQALHVFDPSWVAAWRSRGLGDPFGESEVADTGRVLTELYGGHEGWHSVLSGIAKGSAGGNLYDQQCKTPDVRHEVPVQRVTPEQLTVVRAAEHFDRKPNGTASPGIKDMPETEVAYSIPIPASDPGFDLNNVNPADNADPSNLIGSGICVDGKVSVDLTNQLPVFIDNPPGTASQESDGMTTVKYAYKFVDSTNQKQVKWKIQWLERVTSQFGGNGNVALEVWYFDSDGRLRLHGKGNGGSGTSYSMATPPTPQAPFTFTYFGYDGLGRQNLRVDDFNVALAPDFLGSEYPGQYPFANPNPNTPPNPLAPANTVTYGRYNDFGALISQYVGKQSTLSAPTSSPPVWEPGTWSEVLRTDFLTVGNNVITQEDSNGKPLVAWRDPYSYQFVYEGVETVDAPTQGNANATKDNVHGTTTVSIFDKGMRPIEQRIIAWNGARPQADMPEKIQSFGWGVSAADYSSDGAVAAWGSSPPYSNWECSGDCATDRWNSNGPKGAFFPEHPDGSSVTAANWTPESEDQIVTLARTFKRYTQASTLKPTQDVVYRRFDTAAPSSGEDPREVIRRYNYDLEDRVARQKDPDGTIMRYLYDAKRRPTKVYKGSADGCSDWFPAISSGPDDMVLAQQNLYNDGENCEFSDPFADSTGSCAEGAHQPADYNDFPYDANMLVRTRRFTDSPDSCGSPLDPERRSRDTQYVYDWRGRPVITREVAVGYDTSKSFANPEVISVTSTIFDNLNRPVMTATWRPDSTAPHLEHIDSDGGWGDWTVNSWNDPDTDPEALGTILAAVPLSLSRTFYDDRGRIYEQRTYNLDSPASPQYTFTRTYRDDLDRVTAELSPSGLTTYSHDGLGRVLRTSTYAKEGSTLGTGNGELELTRTEYKYNAFGNVLAQTHYDRKIGTNGSFTTGSLDNAADSVKTYSCNWYDKAQRLIATANFGTNTTDGYPANHGSAPSCVAQHSDTRNPPKWTGTNYLTHDGGAIDALITRYGYDRAGRRMWTQDAKGIVTRTWYDLLGRTILEAENWKDDQNLAPEGTTGSPKNLNAGSGTNHGNYSGPIRYTAYHYTRGGLMDMIVAVIPNTADANITPDNILWNEVAANDYAAGNFALDGITGSFQATRYVYNGRVYDESLTLSANLSAPDEHAATFPMLISEIQYPNKLTGQPDPNDALKFTWTLTGRVATRTDQRGVTLRYGYGDCDASGVEVDLDPSVDQLACVDVDYPTNPNPPIDQSTDHLEFNYDSAGRAILAATYGPSSSPSILQTEVAFSYDSFGNLTHEMLNPFPAGDLTKTTTYVWQWNSPASNARAALRLDSMTYPSAVTYDFNYGAAGSTTDQLNRLTSFHTPGQTHVDVLKFRHLGSGQSVYYGFGYQGGDIKADLANSTSLDRFNRVVDLKFTGYQNAVRAQMKYGYDSNGNRDFSRLTQNGANRDNIRSYKYDYDRLNRLTQADRGILDANNATVSGAGGKGLPSVTARRQKWELNVLGVWAGVLSPAAAGLTEYLTTNTTFANVTYTQTQSPDLANRLNSLTIDPDGSGPDSSDTQDIVHDEAGNLVFDGVHERVYDAWNRVAEIRESGDRSVQNGILTGTQGPVRQRNRYDALGRKVSVTTGADVQPADWPDEFLYYDGHRILEQWTVGQQAQQTSLATARPTLASFVIAPTLARRFYYGNEGFNDLVAVDVNGQRHYALKDANKNVVTMINASQVGTNDEVAQQYSYAPYGTIDFVEDGAGNALTLNDLLQPILFQNMWRDPLTGDYCTPSGRCYDPMTGRWRQGDTNALGFHMSSLPHYHGMSLRLSPSVTSRGQYVDGLNRYGYARFNPARFTDAMGYFSYGELLTTAGIQGAMGGMISGIASRFAGGSFYEGFKSGALTGALSGGVGYAFTAARAGFIGSVVLKEAAQGFVDDFASSYYSTGDFTDSLVEGLYGAATNVVTGGLGSLNAKQVKAFGTLGFAAVDEGADQARKGFRTFTRENFRHNVALYWGLKPPPAGYHAHHVFPVDFEDLFREKGINPHNPILGAWWEEADHLKNAKQYNQRWKDFDIKSHSTEEIIEFGRNLAKEKKLSVTF